ncbi:unnamed protein product [Arctogadus glacialis]
MEVHANVVADAAALQSHVNSEEADDKSETPQPDPEEGPAPKRRPSALVTLLGKAFTGVCVVRKSASTRAEEIFGSPSTVSVREPPELVDDP